ncbi:MAG: tRNA (adenosine(37)-N6)-threonylcarbamoyltransferase complex dimerization subunit type 1 TsaB [Solibacillus sp.]
MIWLGIETANAPLSVALVKDGKVLAEIVQNVKLTHSVGAMPTVEEVFQKAGLAPSDIDAVAVSEGPGSYTGVRIGVTLAKTIAWTLQKPLVGVTSLQVLAGNARLFNGLVCPIFDARRSNVYAGIYDGATLAPVVEDFHDHIDGLFVKLQELEGPILFIGTDVAIFEERIREVLGERAVFASFTQHLPRASELIMLALDKELPSIEATHHFVPQYRRIAEAEANWIKEQKKEQA